MENLTLKVEGNTHELVIREGDALPQVAPKKIVINGDIKTVSSFLKKRAGLGENRNPGLQGILTERVLVTVDKTDLSIKLQLDPENEYGTEVTAKLSYTPEIELFHINKNKLFNREELIKLIKFSKIWFADPEAHDKLLKAYQAFTATVTANTGKNTDGRGNIENNYKKTVETNIPDSFVLNIPIFKGMDKRRFRVEIGIDSTDASTKFWMESVELNDIIQIEGQQILEKELESCADYVVIWK